MAKLIRTSIGDQVVDAVVDLVTSAGLDGGDPLPSTTELADRFGVSRSVVREALAELAGRGLLQRRQGRLSMVMAPGAEAVQDLLSFQMRMQSIDTKDLLDLREATERHAVRLAASRRSSADVDLLRELVNEQTKASTEHAFLEADTAFHTAIASAARSSLLQLVVEAVLPLVWQMWMDAFGQRRSEVTLRIREGHDAILRAIEAGDAEAADIAMSAHLSWRTILDDVAVG